MTVSRGTVWPEADPAWARIVATVAEAQRRQRLVDEAVRQWKAKLGLRAAYNPLLSLPARPGSPLSHPANFLTHLSYCALCRNAVAAIRAEFRRLCDCPICKGSAMADLTIPVKYSCAVCHLHRVEVAVPVREPEQDVVQWIEGCAVPALAADHRRRSPDCDTTEFSEVLIPMDGRDHVGGPVKQ